MPDIEYLKQQAKRARTTPLRCNKEHFLWRILNNSDELGFSRNGNLTPSQWQKAQAIADKVLSDD